MLQSKKFIRMSLRSLPFLGIALISKSINLQATPGDGQLRQKLRLRL